jgi:hypothetical protein
MTSPTGPSGEFYRCLRYSFSPLSLPPIVSPLRDDCGPPSYANAQHLHPSLSLPPSIRLIVVYVPRGHPAGRIRRAQADGHKSPVALRMRPPGPWVGGSLGLPTTRFRATNSTGPLR